MEEKVTGQEEREERGRKKDRRGSRKGSGVSVLVLPVTALLVAALTAGLFYLGYRQREPEQEGLVYEGSIVTGDIPGESREERQGKLDAVVEEGMLAMTINATPSGKTSDEDRSVSWLIKNPSNQEKLIRAEVWRDDTGEKIYEMGTIPPGNYMEDAPLLADSPAGEYNCTAKFFAYKEGETYVGQAAARMRLVLCK